MKLLDFIVDAVASLVKQIGNLILTIKSSKKEKKDADK